jgi:hypothetical protein
MEYNYYDTNYWHYNTVSDKKDYIYVGNQFGELDLSQLDFNYTGDYVTPDDQTSEIGGNLLEQCSQWGYTPENTTYSRISGEIGGDTFPDWCTELAYSLGVERGYIAVQRSMPGTIIPWHTDSHWGSAQRYGVKPEEIRRYSIFPEDWHWGHLFQVGNSCLTDWKKGDIITWNYKVPHLTANAGTVPKYTMRITGPLSREPIL